MNHNSMLYALVVTLKELRNQFATQYIMDVTYRHALITDLTTIVEIYNSTIASGTVTADTEPVTIESKVQWFKEHGAANRPLLLVNNSEKQIIGWVSFQSFYGRPAYNATAEISIYLHESYRGKGIGKKVLDHCIEIAPDLGLKTLLGFIFKHNEPSLKLFHNGGFKNWAELPDIAEINGVERSLIITGLRVA